jgi:hypothetical protein
MYVIIFREKNTGGIIGNSQDEFLLNKYVCDKLLRKLFVICNHLKERYHCNVILRKILLTTDNSFLGENVIIVHY